MMLYPAMSELLAQVPSRYQLVNVVAARARRIATEARQQEIVLNDKPVSIAIREIAGDDKQAEEPEVSEISEISEISEVSELAEVEEVPEVSESSKEPEQPEEEEEEEEELILFLEEPEAE